MNLTEFTNRCIDADAKEELQNLRMEALNGSPSGLSCKDKEEWFRAGEIYAINRARVAAQTKSKGE